METGDSVELHQGDKQPVWMSSVSFLQKKKKEQAKEAHHALQQHAGKVAHPND